MKIVSILFTVATQVDLKAEELLSMFSQAQGPQLNYIINTLADRAVSQAEAVVSLELSNAIPLVMVLSKVAEKYP